MDSTVVKKDVIYLEKNDDLQSVLNCFRLNKISHVPVVEQNKLVGMVSKTDVTQYLSEILKSDSSRSLQDVAQECLVKEIMIQPIVKANIRDSQASILEKFLVHKVGSVVICDENKIAGILTEKDMLEYLSHQLDEDLSFTEKVGYHLVDWLNKNGITRLSSMLADIGI